MQRKERFPPEADTQPEVLRAKVLAARRSERAPKRPDQRAEAPTEPPPPPARAKGSSSVPRETTDSRPSGMRTRRHSKTGPSATVDEVVADLSQDPRRERDEDD
jgi:hypothetical protein